MGAPQVATAFLDLLEKSKLLLPEQLADRQGLHELPSAKDVAKALIVQGLITRFQAERLLKGRYRGFFFGSYKLLELLGTGGMGGLYMAEHVESGERVALKILHPHDEEDPGLRARFAVEGQAGAMLNHPNIVRTRKVDREGDIYYVVMDFVEGANLEELVALHGKLAWPQACDIACQTAVGLEHIHQANLVHRDIKPSNLVIQRDGTVKIVDFGLVLLDREDQEFSLAMIFGQDCLGTADYVAPEQTVDSYTVDSRADIYSLGCTLYFALTGEVPFPGKSISKKLDYHRRKKPRPVRDFAADVPDQVLAVLERMICKRPENRYPTAVQAARALAPLAQRRPVNFDFQELLARRAYEAKRRVAALEERRKKASPSNSTITRSSMGSTISPRGPLVPNERSDRGSKAALGSKSDLSGRSPAPTPPSAPAAAGKRMIEIRHRESGDLLLQIQAETLVGKHLGACSLPGADLAGANLAEVMLANSDLRDADLQDATLSGARLTSATLTGATLERANLAQADLMNGILNRCNFTGAVLSKCNLRFAKLAGAKLCGADLSGADLSMSDLRADLSQANLARADLRGADLSGAVLTGAILEGANLTGANLNGANLSSAKVDGAIDPRGKPLSSPARKEDRRPWWKLGGK